ncbi:inorganic phosphate transporter [Sodalis sp. CWE]|uniref:inorganic phosphate transporter n=1 Tax=Sodalis sp. CWE TaxID=2803816 RepID=UPI001C7CA1F0|nr:inorganic phosphate transporter [Sodalis sp. CWE]MBX4181060.1 inorganic phosphate transporter [Sodalis sp. CWE]
MPHLFTNIGEYPTGLMLVFALVFVLIYEAINGFHDTANAVAIVIYTRTLCSKLAVIMSGVFNFFGVLTGGLSVAYTIIHLFPTELLLNISSICGLAMMFSMLLAAILWNIGTWYFGLPTSSSHTLIGSIIGIGLTNALISNTSMIQALNVSKLIEVCLSLIISPIVGLVPAGAIVFCFRHYCNDKKTYFRINLTPTEREKKDGKQKPPFWTRIALILSAAGVSFSHGSNDGQKGIGLIMLMLIGIMPAKFVVNMNANDYDISRTYDAVSRLERYYMQHYSNELISNPIIIYSTNKNVLTVFNSQTLNQINHHVCSQAKTNNCGTPERVLCAINYLLLLLNNLDNYETLNADQRSSVRYLLIYIADIADNMALLPEMPTVDKRLLLNLRKDLLNTIEYAPTWVIFAVALSLSIGTTVGWRRVVTTVGEKIGKKNMTYAQGLSAQLTAAISIGIASYTGMPVSTTHVVSSAVTGSMLIDGGGLQITTIKNILLAWILTLPVTIILAGSLYWTLFCLI